MMEYIRLLFISEFKINIIVALYYFLHIIYTLYFYIFYIMPLIVKPISAELVKDKDFLGKSVTKSLFRILTVLS